MSPGTMIPGALAEALHGIPAVPCAQRTATGGGGSARGCLGNGVILVMLVKKIYHKPHETTHIVMAYTSHGQIGYGLLLLYQHYTGFWVASFQTKPRAETVFMFFFPNAIFWMINNLCTFFKHI